MTSGSMPGLKADVGKKSAKYAVAYLAGARNVTGQMICVDAGQHLAWRTPDIVD